MKNPFQLKTVLATGAALYLASLGNARAGSFISDFNSGLPPGSAVYGNSLVSNSGGVTNSGCLQLTTAVNSQTGGFIITNDLDAGTPVVSFVARFKALIGGGTAADGFSFNFAPDLPLGTITEEGGGTGLSVEFDTYSNDASDDIGVDLHVGGGINQQYPFSGLRQNTFVDVYIALNPDKTMNVIYDGTQIYTNVDVSFLGSLPFTGGLFGFGGRTGGQNDNQFIDNLSIVTQTNAAAFVDTFAPMGRRVRADAPINIVLNDFVTAVNTNNIVLNLDGTNVTPNISQGLNTPGTETTTTISYVPPQIFASASQHTVTVTYVDDSLTTNNFQYSFAVSAYVTLPTSLLAPALLVSTNPGFVIHVAQIAANFGPTIQRAEKELANQLFDPSTALPYVNLANPNPNDGSFTYLETNAINYSTAGFQGDFPTENGNTLPGIPGTQGYDTNAAMDVETYLYLTNGIYTLGVNSSDGFALTASTTPDVFSPLESSFNSVRSFADTLTTFAVAQPGYYPFRLTYFSGGTEAVNPSLDALGLEFFSQDALGNKVLINDTNTPGYIPAAMPAQTLPYIQSLSPAPGDTGVAHGTAIDATLVNGTITVQTNTIQLSLNGTNVTPVITTNGGGLTTIHYQPPGGLALNSSNTVLLAFTDSNATRRTNSYTFAVENILNQLWVISPTQSTNATWQKWITAGSTERGIAYNPRTGHVLIVSRNTATGTDGPAGLGVGVFDGDTGLYIKQLNMGTIGSTGVGTFKINLVRVADDGAIYVCNLSTSAAQNFQVYRWQDENSAPTVAYNAAPTASAGTPRWGDDFAIRRSGAGTQLLVCGNNASVNNVELFTTTDGVNFSLSSILSPTSLPNNSVRLGLAFGPGNTFYGETTGSGNPVRYVSFTGPGATTGSLLGSYTLLDYLNTQGLGPIGVDIANQRIIGDETSGADAHSMNLYDLNALSLTPTNNLPIDHKPYGTSTGSFGTGAVDFSPDGTRVYTLDTGNGVIAFSLAPKVAAPIITNQPANFFVTNGALGFFGVEIVGSTPKYQWKINGTNIPNATNRTIDISNVKNTNYGKYTVVITNSLGSVTSAVALLDLPLSITNQPVDQSAAVGGSASFNVGASGLTPFTYQWRLNGTNVSNATLSSLTINNAQITNAGSYTVVVTDPVGQAVTSAVAGLTVGTPGTGTGLNGDYYSGQTNFAGLPVLSELDPTINFNYGTGSPNGSIAVDKFAIRWAGQVQPFYSQTYTFYVTSDDGSRLWVNGKKLIDKWVNQSATESSGTIALTSGQKYDLVLEYYENTGSASVSLSWSSLGQAKQIIPMTQLYPSSSSPATPALGAPTASANGSSITMTWNGSYTLQTAPTVSGPWTDLPAATSPYTINPGNGAQQFFRLKSN